MSLQGTNMYPVIFQINGERKTIWARGADTLLHVLREGLGLTGCKPGCENGDCGACTILVNDLPMKSCLMLAVEAEGQKLTTIEGLNHSPVQQAFVQKQAFQCGYCTPGFIMNCQGLVNLHPHANEEMVQLWLESNICRCTSYEEIHEVVKMIFAFKSREEP
ncbi:(2Fe-2S)-binding protein [Paenibacillus aceris]|uniref:Carbon-monoxide dehydrogenase small subunit n=1 Tax=Paenibacillus aceris TaxID=869555 RepID=A0ABS4HZN9_9BACL|nr:(2Fe-2S)-binding protein [Paenibacillus aceris]MBP1964105.1 carbon-monoxide dehydrogenase small subunit [Paenibacillus aceris]NHW36442.1 (2Fe-2S)-binding protein [Paenibacillus aceris]